jgi:hypothetical protein
MIGLFVLACFYTLKIAASLFLPMVLAGFLGFLLTPVTRWLKRNGVPELWAPILSTISFLMILICRRPRSEMSLARLMLWQQADRAEPVFGGL